MKNKPLLIVSLVVIAWQTGFGQFQHGIGDKNLQTGRSVQHTRIDDGYIIAGLIRGNAPLGLTDANVTRTNQNGNVLWSMAIGRGRDDIFNSIREVTNANTHVRYVAAGHTNSISFGDHDMYLAGLDPNGIPVFSHIYGGREFDRGHCVQNVFGPDGKPGYIIAGETKSFQHLFPGTSIYIVRTDINGASMDQAVIGTEGDDVAYWIEQTRDGGYLVAGTTTQRCDGDTFANRNIFVLRLDPLLNILWNVIASGPESQEDVAYCVRENLVDNSVIVTGNTRSWGLESESFLLNLTPGGGFNWMRLYGREKLEYAQNVLVTQDYNNNPEYIVSGFTDSFNAAARFDPMLFKTDLGGNLKWTRTYGGPEYDYGYELDEVPPASGGPGVDYVLTGSTRSFTHGQDDILLLEVNNDGKYGGPCEFEPKQKERRVEPCVTSSAQAVEVKPWKEIKSDYKRLDYGLIRCEKPSPFTAKAETLPDSAAGKAAIPASVTVGPNPTTATVQFSVDRSFYGSALSIVDGSGAVVYTTTIADATVSLDLGSLTPGLYIARIRKPDGTLATIRVLKK